MGRRRPQTSAAVEAAVSAYLTDVGRALRAARIRKRVTRQMLQEKTGLSLRGLHEIEAGKSNITLATFARICLALHVSPDSLGPHGLVGQVARNVCRAAGIDPATGAGTRPMKLPDHLPLPAQIGGVPTLGRRRKR